MQGDRRISEWPFEPNDEGDAAEGLLPAGPWDWDQVLGPTLKFLPWPYTDVEFARIWDALPHPGAALATKEAIFAARWFLHSAYLRQKHGLAPKADPCNELKRIIRASRELRDAICAASGEAIEHLSRNLAPVAVKQPVQAHDLLSALFWFEHDNRLTLRDPPEAERIGAPHRTREEVFIYQLWCAWRVAHAANPPARGWPAFRAACVDPLARSRFPKLLRSASRTEREWQGLLRRARVRFEGAIK